MDSIPDLRSEIKKKENEIQLLRENSDTEKEKQITEKEKQITEIQNQISEILKQITAKENQITAQSTYCMHYLTFFFCFTDTSFSPIPIRLLFTVRIFTLGSTLA